MSLDSKKYWEVSEQKGSSVTGTLFWYKNGSRTVRPRVKQGQPVDCDGGALYKNAVPPFPVGDLDINEAS